MVNSNNGSSSNPPASASGSGTAQSGGSSLGVIPGSGTKAKHGLRAEVTQVVTGIGTQFPAGTSLTVKGVPLSKDQLLAQLAAGLALFADVDAAVQALRNERLALEAATPDLRRLLTDVKAALVALFGKGNPALVAFGFSGKKPKVLTPEQQLARKVKLRGTRKLRGTLGPVEKQDVKLQGKVEIQTSVAGIPAPSGNAPPAGGNSAGASSDASKS